MGGGSQRGGEEVWQGREWVERAGVGGGSQRGGEEVWQGREWVERAGVGGGSQRGGEEVWQGRGSVEGAGVATPRHRVTMCCRPSAEVSEARQGERRGDAEPAAGDAARRRVSHHRCPTRLGESG